MSAPQARPRRRVAVAVALASMLASTAWAGLSEYEVKAAFLYNFSKFIQWPAGSFETAKAPLVIGVLGEDPFGDLLDGLLVGKTVGGRAIAVRRAADLDALGRCHMIFVSTSEHGRLYEILDRLDKASVVTIGETPDFISAGGMIQLRLVDNHVRFAIDNTHAERVGIRISSKVLSLSRIMVARHR